jgi:hypothetical protein
MQNEKPMNFFQKLIKIFTAPSEVLQDIKESPKFLFPFIYVFVVTVITKILQRPMIELQQQEIQNLYLEKYGVDIFSLSQKGLMNSNSIVVNIFGTLIGLWVAWLISSAFLLLISKILKGEATYKQLLSLVIHAGMLTSTLILITTPIDLILNSSSTVFSLSVLYPGGNMTSFLYNILNSMTLFSIWAVILKGMGLYILNDFSKRKGYLTSIFSYIVSTFFAAGSASVSFWIIDMLYRQGNL